MMMIAMMYEAESQTFAADQLWISCAWWPCIRVCTGSTFDLNMLNLQQATVLGVRSLQQPSPIKWLMETRDKNVTTVNITLIENAHLRCIICMYRCVSVCAWYCSAAGITVLKLVLVNGHYRSYRCTCCVISVNVLCSKNQAGTWSVHSNEPQPSVCVPSRRWLHHLLCLWCECTMQWLLV